MSKFKFEIEVGIVYRKEIKNMLNKSKINLEYAYEGGTVHISELKSFLESTFIVTGTGFPDTTKFNNEISDWKYKLKSLCN